MNRRLQKNGRFEDVPSETRDNSGHIIFYKEKNRIRKKDTEMLKIGKMNDGRKQCDVRWINAVWYLNWMLTLSEGMNFHMDIPLTSYN